MKLTVNVRSPNKTAAFQAAVEQIVSQFRAISPPLVETMREKARDGDLQGVWQDAHNLRSSAAAIAR